MIMANNFLAAWQQLDDVLWSNVVQLITWTFVVWTLFATWYNIRSQSRGDEEQVGVAISSTILPVQEQAVEKVADTFRSHRNKEANKEINDTVQQGVKLTNCEENGAGGSSQLTAKSNSHLPPAVTQLDSLLSKPEFCREGQQKSSLTNSTGYTTSRIPGATQPLTQQYITDFDKKQPLSVEEISCISNKKSACDVQHKKQCTGTNKVPPSTSQWTSQKTGKPAANLSNTQKPFPRRACLVYKNEQYSLDPKLLSLPRVTKYLVKQRTEICPGRYVAKLQLHCAR